MSALERFLQALPLALAAAICATACVRASPPDKYACASDADCNGDERCSMLWCIPRDFCDLANDQCGAERYCDYAVKKCKPVECTEQTEAKDCHGYACSQSICLTDCVGSYQCANAFHCEQSRCVAGAPLAIGATCTNFEECNSNVCCARETGSGSTCEASCGHVCASTSDCTSSQFCCADSTKQRRCSPTPCGAVP